MFFCFLRWSRDQESTKQHTHNTYIDLGPRWRLRLRPCTWSLRLRGCMQILLSRGHLRRLRARLKVGGDLRNPTIFLLHLVCAPARHARSYLEAFAIPPYRGNGRPGGENLTPPRCPPVGGIANAQTHPLPLGCKLRGGALWLAPLRYRLPVPTPGPTPAPQTPLGHRLRHRCGNRPLAQLRYQRQHPCPSPCDGGKTAKRARKQQHKQIKNVFD